MALKKKDAGTTPPKHSLRENAEKQLARSKKPSLDLNEQTPEELIHELRVHQIELETQVEELQRIRQELKVVRFKYYDLYDLAPLGYLTLNDKAIVTEANLTVATLLKVERRFLLRARFSKYIFPVDQDQWYIYFADLKGRDTTQICTLTLVREDGSAFPARLESVRYTTPDGSIAIRVMISDISDIKNVQEALSLKEEKYRNLCTHTIDGIALHELVYDASRKPADYRILEVNPVFESITGLKREDVVGKSSREAFGVDTPPFLDIYARVATTGKPEVFAEYFAPMKKHFSISVYSPKKGRFATIFEDITERKLNEVQREMLIQELVQKNAELERFTYTVSHDLKSPLITIRGFVGLIEEDARSGDLVQLKKDLNRIITATDTMQALLADLLELSRVGRSINPTEITGFGMIVHEAVDLLVIPLAERGVTVDIAPDFPYVKVDHARIREVLVNLIENSIKFFDNQSDPVLRIGVDISEESPVFFVQDNGIGIDPRYLERIFNLFEKLDVSVQGTGIGLTIVRRIIESHGGKIWAESRGPGKGTTFRFTLPRVPEGSPVPAQNRNF